ncbi:MAG TPA: cupin domain-containing protein [Dongiaceae bacterium]
MPYRREPSDRVGGAIDTAGFFGPIAFLTPAECRAVAAHLDRDDRPAPLDWWKGHAATDRLIYELAAVPRLLALLRPLLGDDIVLWGAQTITHPSGSIHPWHTDMESAASNGRAMTVWLAIRNAAQYSGLRFVSSSHRFGLTVQEALAGRNADRKTMTDEGMLAIAQTIDPAARIVEPTVETGELLLFDGRIWHASRNDGPLGARTALLLQYASADTPVPMPAAPGYRWPFQFTTSPRVPAVLVSGSGRHSANRLVPPPLPQATKGTAMITTLARSIPLPLADDPVKLWRAYPQFRGQTRTLDEMSCHISVLSAGHHPHPPHIHPEEELLVVLDGEVEVELADDPGGTGSRRHGLKPGMFSYYPATQHHTIHNVGVNPATYLMFKWRSGVADMGEPLPASIFEYERAGLPPGPRPMLQKLLFQQATHCLGKLHAHLTTLQPGAGYEAHADAYDVAIIVLSGEVETVGERVRPLGLIFYSAGELHGIQNVGTTLAVYLVFEFHGPAVVTLKRQEVKKRRGERVKPLAGRIAEVYRKRGIRGVARKIAKTLRKLAR